jgi:hypothetical protein
MIATQVSKINAVIGTKAAPVTGIISQSGGTVVVASPGDGLRNIVEGWQWQATADGDNTMLLKIGSVVFDGVIVATKAHGLRSVDVEYVGAENTAVIIDLATTVPGRYFIWYRVEPAA